MAGTERPAAFGFRLRTSDFGLHSGFGFRDSDLGSVGDAGSSIVNRLPWPGGAADQHPAAVGLDDVFHNAQANAHALGLAPQLGAAAVEALEDLLLLGRRDAFAVVLDPETDA